MKKRIEATMWSVGFVSDSAGVSGVRGLGV